MPTPADYLMQLFGGQSPQVAAPVAAAAPVVPQVAPQVDPIEQARQASAASQAQLASRLAAMAAPPAATPHVGPEATGWMQHLFGQYPVENVTKAVGIRPEQGILPNLLHFGIRALQNYGAMQMGAGAQRQFLGEQMSADAQRQQAAAVLEHQKLTEKNEAQRMLMTHMLAGDQAAAMEQLRHLHELESGKIQSGYQEALAGTRSKEQIELENLRQKHELESKATETPESRALTYERTEAGNLSKAKASGLENKDISEMTPKELRIEYRRVTQGIVDAQSRGGDINPNDMKRFTDYADKLEKEIADRQGGGVTPAAPTQGAPDGRVKVIVQ